MKVFGIILGAIGTIFLFFVHWILGAVFIVTAIILLLIPKEKQREEEETKTCPRCAEKVKKEAKICRFCQYEFPPPPPPSPEEVEREEAHAEYEQLRSRLNELAELIHKTKDKSRRHQLETERKQIDQALNKLRNKISY